MQRRVAVVGMPPRIEVVVRAAGVVNNQCTRGGGLLPIYRRVVVLVVLLEDQFALASHQKRIDISVEPVLDILVNCIKGLLREADSRRPSYLPVIRPCRFGERSARECKERRINSPASAFGKGREDFTHPYFSHRDCWPKPCNG